MVTIEAMLSGTPIVATDSGGTSEILEHGKMGHLYPYNNQERFIHELRLILNEMENTREMTKRAKENATLFFDEKMEVDAIEKILLRYLG
jgi:glycosyltransferase involved in cell wall biosynthesis